MGEVLAANLALLQWGSSVDVGGLAPSYHLWVSIGQIRQISALIGKKSNHRRLLRLWTHLTFYFLHLVSWQIR